jgi:glutaredoxin-related protein
MMNNVEDTLRQILDERMALSRRRYPNMPNLQQIYVTGYFMGILKELAEGDSLVRGSLYRALNKTHDQ